MVPGNVIKHSSRLLTVGYDQFNPSSGTTEEQFWSAGVLSQFATRCNEWKKCVPPSLSSQTLHFMAVQYCKLHITMEINLQKVSLISWLFLNS